MRYLASMVWLAAMPLLAACADDPAWHKSGGNKEMFSLDTTACFRGASIQAQRQMATRGATAGPQIELRASGGRVRDAAGGARKAASLAEKALRGRLYSECMHRLGYRRNQ
ncbi:MAG: hypothetical protein VCE74_01315 [Alphaproteobacteria bacterium]